MAPRRLVVFVEGKGDRTAVPTLAARIVDDLSGHDVLFVDNDPFRVGGLGRLVKDDAKEWRRFLESAAKTRPGLAAILLVLDGDLEHVPRTWRRYLDRFKDKEFCAARVAASLSEHSQIVRGGEAFSVATVFAMKEFEAWLLAGIESLRGIALPEKSWSRSQFCGSAGEH